MPPTRHQEVNVIVLTCIGYPDMETTNNVWKGNPCASLPRHAQATVKLPPPLREAQKPHLPSPTLPAHFLRIFDKLFTINCD